MTNIRFPGVGNELTYEDLQQSGQGQQMISATVKKESKFIQVV